MAHHLNKAFLGSTDKCKHVANAEVHLGVDYIGTDEVNGG